MSYREKNSRVRNSTDTRMHIETRKVHQFNEEQSCFALGNIAFFTTINNKSKEIIIVLSKDIVNVLIFGWIIRIFNRCTS